VAREYPEFEIARMSGKWTTTRRTGTQIQVVARFTLGELRTAIEAVGSSRA
jgi:hypothetical protein